MRTPFCLYGSGGRSARRFAATWPTWPLLAPRDGQVRLLFHGDRDPFRNRKLDRVRVAERQHYILALYFSAVADADDVEILLEAGGDAGDRIGNQRAGKPVQRALIIGGALGRQDAILLFEGDAGRHRHVELALGALHFHFVGLDVDFHARRHRNDFVSNSRHVSCFLRKPNSKAEWLGGKPNYQTSHIISPPMPAFRAACPVIKPCGVETIEMPMPPTTWRMPVFAT